MQISVIIVNYNVKFFLEQCLFSIEKAAKGIAVEVIVIDNNSTDGSIEYLKTLFPDTVFIENNNNVGFGKACNQGLAVAKGEYILFLNPDTLVAESCFEKCIQFFETHADAGAVGVKMLDGKGGFLKESKRAFPSPLSSLFKLSGFAHLFPKSKLFARYHLGHLEKEKNHEVDVLSGAFMLIRKEVFEKIGGGFDEDFYMYGEDIDLSYRIQQAGYKNYYLSEAAIIHFKGESTKKGSLNYVKLFYKAMSQFVKKHYSGSRAGVFNIFIHIAIWARAGITAITNLLVKWWLLIVHGAAIVFSFKLMCNVWKSYTGGNVEFINGKEWETYFVISLVYLVCIYYAGFYDRYYKISRVLRAIVGATAFLFLTASLLSVQYKFPLTILLSGAIMSVISILFLHWNFKVLGFSSSSEEESKIGSILVVGNEAEFRELSGLYTSVGMKERILGRIALDENKENCIGSINDIKRLVGKIPIQEIIFCEGEQDYQTIFEQISGLPSFLRIKFHSSGSKSVVGSDSKNGIGESISEEVSVAIASSYSRRMKRLIDFIAALLGLLLFPVHLFGIIKPFSFFKDCFSVLLGKKTWVGYASRNSALPKIREGVLAPNGAVMPALQKLSDEILYRMDYWYAKEYRPQKDIDIILKSYRLVWRIKKR